MRVFIVVRHDDRTNDKNVDAVWLTYEEAEAYCLRQERLFEDEETLFWDIEEHDMSLSRDHDMVTVDG